MRRDLPPPNWLRAFEATARHLSFTHAAAELGLTQAAVSKRVKLLEQHLNEPLFVRKTRSLLLTKSGEAFLPKVVDAFDRLEAGTREVFGARRQDALILRSTVAFSVNWLGPRLVDFQQRYPHVELRVVTSVWNEGDIGRVFDLDIRYGTESSIAAHEGIGTKGTDSSKMRLDRLTWDTIMPVCSPHMIEEDLLSSVDALANHILIHVLGYREGWARWLEAAGRPDLHIGKNLQVDTSLLAFQMAAKSAGVALARSSLVQGDLQANRLAKPFELSVPIDEAFYLTGGTGANVHEHADTFRTWLLEQVEISKAL